MFPGGGRSCGEGITGLLGGAVQEALSTIPRGQPRMGGKGQ